MGIRKVKRFLGVRLMCNGVVFIGRLPSTLKESGGALLLVGSGGERIRPPCVGRITKTRRMNG